MTVLNEKVVDLNVQVGDLKIQKAKVYHIKLPLTEPFKISLGTQYDYSGTVVELDSGEIEGYGEGSTIEEITGEVPAGVFETALHILNRLKDRKYSGIEELLEDVYKSVYANPTAKDAVDTAIHDIVSKHYGIHLTRLLGGGPKEMQTSLTIGLGTVKENLQSLERLKRMKSKVIKVKVGKNADDDIERIKAISEHLEGREFYVDANQGYKLGDAMKVANVLGDSGALFFEQPLDRHALQDLRALRRQSGIPIMLDESISEPLDVIDAILSESADLVNVKLTKSGGIRKAFKTLITAQSYGIDSMVGCMIESKVGIAASLAVASSLSNVKYTDLDGFHSIKIQPFDGGLEYRSGINIPVSKPGLACAPIRKNW